MSFLLLIILGTLAFNAQCFYVDTNSTNKMDIDSSDVLTKTFATSTVPSKDNSICKYSIDEGSFVGHHAGEGINPLFHRWECDADQNYGILVKNCYASDYQLRKVRFIDEEGCVDSYFGESQLVYSFSSNMAYVVMDTFKFADSSIVHISCEIELCDKRLGQCRGITPPICKGESPRINNQRVVANYGTPGTSDNIESSLVQITKFLEPLASTVCEWIDISQKPEQLLVKILISAVCMSLILILFRELVHLMIYLAIKYISTKRMVKKPSKNISKNIIDV